MPCATGSAAGGFVATSGLVAAGGLAGAGVRGVLDPVAVHDLVLGRLVLGGRDAVDRLVAEVLLGRQRAGDQEVHPQVVVDVTGVGRHRVHRRGEPEDAGRLEPRQAGLASEVQVVRHHEVLALVEIEEAVAVDVADKRRHGLAVILVGHRLVREPARPVPRDAVAPARAVGPRPGDHAERHGAVEDVDPAVAVEVGERRADGEHAVAVGHRQRLGRERAAEVADPEVAAVKRRDEQIGPGVAVEIDERHAVDPRVLERRDVERDLREPAAEVAVEHRTVIGAERDVLPAVLVEVAGRGAAPDPERIGVVAHHVHEAVVEPELGALVLDELAGPAAPGEERRAPQGDVADRDQLRGRQACAGGRRRRCAVCGRRRGCGRRPRWMLRLRGHRAVVVEVAVHVEHLVQARRDQADRDDREPQSGGDADRPPARRALPGDHERVQAVDPQAEQQHHRDVGRQPRGIQRVGEHHVERHRHRQDQADRERDQHREHTALAVQRVERHQVAERRAEHAGDQHQWHGAHDDPAQLGPEVLDHADQRGAERLVDPHRAALARQPVLELLQILDRRLVEPAGQDRYADQDHREVEHQLGHRHVERQQRERHHQDDDVERRRREHQRQRHLDPARPQRALEHRRRAVDAHPERRAEHHAVERAAHPAAGVELPVAQAQRQ
ncbi:MAG TPA: hypothetical protein VH165_09215 [Kofleriaceae bacterium]|jgi:hypothetical protein|nr:hypothetical protein [Kofleriaceae bacterium]